MWVRRAAIRPVPQHAKIPEQVLDAMERDLGEGEPEEAALLDGALERFESRQPALTRHMESSLAKFKSEPSLGFGYFLMVAVYLAFERAFGDDLDTVDETALAAALESLTLDEEIRMADPAEVVESDDVIAMEQPHLLRYIQDHVDAALEAHADEIDVDDVHAIYRAVLLEILSLSHAVKPPRGAAQAEIEA